MKVSDPKVIGAIVVVSVLLASGAYFYYGDVQTVWNACLVENPDLEYCVYQVVRGDKGVTQLEVLTPNITTEDPNDFVRYKLDKDELIVYNGRLIGAKAKWYVDYYKTYGEDKWVNLKRKVRKIDLELEEYETYIILRKDTEYYATASLSGTGGHLIEEFKVGQTWHEYSAKWVPSEARLGYQHRLHWKVDSFGLGAETPRALKNDLVLNFDRSVIVNLLDDKEDIKFANLTSTNLLVDFVPKKGIYKLNSPSIGVGTVKNDWYSLISSDKQCLTECHATFKVCNPTAGDVLTNNPEEFGVDFVKKTVGASNVDSWHLERLTQKNIARPIYDKLCNEPNEEPCKIVGNTTSTIDEWVSTSFDDLLLQSQECATLRLTVNRKAQVGPNTIDWIPTIGGFRVSEDADLNSNWGEKTTLTITFASNVVSGDIIRLKDFDLDDMTCADENCADLRITDSTETMDLNRMIYGVDGNAEAEVYFKLGADYASGAHVFYAYSDNSDVPFPPLIMHRIDGRDADTDPISGVDWDHDGTGCTGAGTVEYQATTTKFGNALHHQTDGADGSECRTQHAIEIGEYDLMQFFQMDSDNPTGEYNLWADEGEWVMALTGPGDNIHLDPAGGNTFSTDIEDDTWYILRARRNASDSSKNDYFLYNEYGILLESWLSQAPTGSWDTLVARQLVYTQDVLGTQRNHYFDELMVGPDSNVTETPSYTQEKIVEDSASVTLFKPLDEIWIGGNSVNIDVNAWALQFDGGWVDSNVSADCFADQNITSGDTNLTWDSTDVDCASVFDINIAAHVTNQANVVTDYHLVHIDNTIPTVTGILADEWNATDLNVPIEFDDADPGDCNWIYYSYGDSNFQGELGTDGDTNFGIELSTAGDYNVFFWVGDRADNNSAHHLVTAKIDNNAPAVTIQLPVDNNSWWESKIIEFDLNDNLSGADILTAGVDINGVASSIFDASQHCTKNDLNWHCSYTETIFDVNGLDYNITVYADDNVGLNGRDEHTATWIVTASIIFGNVNDFYANDDSGVVLQPGDLVDQNVTPFGQTDVNGIFNITNDTFYLQYTAGETTQHRWFEGFEAGSLDANWTEYTEGTGRIQVTGTGTPNNGSYHVLMDSSSDSSEGVTGIYTGNDMTGGTDFDLNFYNKEFSDEDDECFGASGTTSGVQSAIDGDCAVFTCDGTTWYELVDLSPSTVNYTKYTSGDWVTNPNTQCGTFTSNFSVGFFWSDNFIYSTDGFAYDDIEVTWYTEEAGTVSAGSGGNIDVTMDLNANLPNSNDSNLCICSQNKRVAIDAETCWDLNTSNTAFIVDDLAYDVNKMFWMFSDLNLYGEMSNPQVQYDYEYVWG